MNEDLPVSSEDEEAGERFKRLLKKSAEDEQRLLQELCKCSDHAMYVLG